MRVVQLLLVVVLATLAGCASAPKPLPLPMSPVPTVTPPKPASAQYDDLLFHAFSLVGTPYRWGGNAPETGFDCSGLINYVFRETAGVTLPRTTAGLSALPGTAAADALLPGDLVLFATKGGQRVDHAGIYVGDGRFVHAPSSGGKVRLDSLQASYWQRSFTSARRVLD